MRQTSHNYGLTQLNPLCPNFKICACTKGPIKNGDSSTHFVHHVFVAGLNFFASRQAIELIILSQRRL